MVGPAQYPPNVFVLALSVGRMIFAKLSGKRVFNFGVGHMFVRMTPKKVSKQQGLLPMPAAMNAGMNVRALAAGRFPEVEFGQMRVLGPENTPNSRHRSNEGLKRFKTGD